VSSLKKDFFKYGKVEDCPVYDMHGHMGAFYGAHFPIPDPDSMVRRMRRCGVKFLAFCHHANLFSEWKNNTENIEAVRRYPKELRAYCGVNPNYPDSINEMLSKFDEFRDVFIGFKMLPDYHGMPLTHENYRPVWEFADRNSLIVLIHSWGNSPNDGPEQIGLVAEKYQKLKINMGHSCHGEWDKALALVNKFPNLYLDLCAVLDDRGILEKFVKETDVEKILFGTDFPWFDYHWYIGAVMGADITDTDRRKILHGNAEKLLKSCGRSK